MPPASNRAHGVTPGLRADYSKRTASEQAAFVLPYLRPGMDLVDLGCGPGTITLGLAQAVAPGRNEAAISLSASDCPRSYEPQGSQTPSKACPLTRREPRRR